MIDWRRLTVALTVALGLLQSAWGQESPSEEPNTPPAQQVDNFTEQKPAFALQTGLAAFYHATFQGRRTASGETFDHNGLTAAHKTLPFGTLVRVLNLRNNRSVVVRINDRGPFQSDRVIDVTRRVAELLGFALHGMTRVTVEVVQPAVK